MSEPAQKCENNAIFMQNNALELFISLKMVISCYFCWRGNLNFPDFLQIKFYNINYRYVNRTENGFLRGCFLRISDFLNWPIPASLFRHFNLFNAVDSEYKLPMTRFELQISGVVSVHSSIWAAFQWSK